MYDRRLKVLLSFFAVALAIIVGRLAQLQLVQGAYYSERARRSLMLRPKPLPFVRGRILDRTGRVLACDQPSWDLTIDYAVLAADVGNDPGAIKQAVRRWRKRYRGADTDEAVEAAFRLELAAMWRKIAWEFAAAMPPVSVETLRARGKRIHERVRRVREVVASRRGFDSPVAEETVAHPILSELDANRQIRAREISAAYPWLHVEPASLRRAMGDATAFAHLLGRMGRVDARTVAEDPDAADPFARYLADERVGISGVEYAAEGMLRGRRGQMAKERDDTIVEVIEAEDGRDVTVTIHADLQRRLYRLLDEKVRDVSDSSGGVIVVLEIPSREVLALVSYPSYDPAHFKALYSTLRDDTERLPLRFRAVANRYQPGSTIKPLVCMAGLMSGKITLDTREECTGYLFAGQRDRWRCWSIQGTGMRMAHGYVDVVEALAGSCNVFMYKLGESLGADRLCSVFEMVGIGRESGIGLREEAIGVNPTPSWLATNKNTPVYAAHPRLFAIGQGEILMTPVQVANLMATYASGTFRPLTLIRTSTPSPQWKLPGTPRQWHAVREGIYRVVNDPNGTAYRYAHFQDDQFVLCGKTGSATTHRRPTSYEIRYVDVNGLEAVASVRAGTRREAVERFSAEHPTAKVDSGAVNAATWWPPRPPPASERYSHAWFAGYLQPVDLGRRPDWSQEPGLAFAVLIEYGGSGGRTCGPLAKQVAAELLDVFGPDLKVENAAFAGAIQ